MNLNMSGEVAENYKSGSQIARVVTELWAEHNLYCPNCPSPKLSRLTHNTKANDFACPDCKFWFQLKGQQARFGKSVTDGAYGAMMHAIQNDQTPNFYFMHYELATWTVKNLLLIPHFAFPPSAIIKRNPLAATARRAGWVGCNIALTHIPVEARIPVVAEGVALPVKEVRAQFKLIKPLADIKPKERGWMLDVLNLVRTLGKVEFTNEDAYALAPALKRLHPENHHVEAKIRQQLQVLRDAGFLLHVERGRWRLPAS